ncbi:MAG: hypothetical protein V1799_05765 [bacterium]
MKRSPQRIPFILFCLLVCVLSLHSQKVRNDSQTKSNNAASTLRSQYETRLSQIFLTNVTRQKHYVDSLSREIIKLRDILQRGVSKVHDTLIVAAARLFNALRRDSLQRTSFLLTQPFQSLTDRWNTLSGNLLNRETTFLKAQQSLFGRSSISDQDESVERIEEYSSIADSVSEMVLDSSSCFFDTIIDNLTEAADAARDSLESVYWLLEEDQQKENDLLAERQEAIADSLAEVKEHASRLVVSMYYNHHATYRGRDNGISYNSFVPTLTYTHRSGFSLGLMGIIFPNHPERRYEGTGVSLGYSGEIAAVVSSSITYTHFWFGKNSAEPRSYMNDNLWADLDINLGSFSMNLASTYDIGSKSEFNGILTSMVLLDLGKPFGADRFVGGPVLSALYGQQDATLTSVRLTILKKRTISTTVTEEKKVFGVLCYEPMLILSYQKGGFNLKPSLVYEIPLNVVDNSTSHPFLNVTLEMSYTIR